MHVSHTHTPPQTLAGNAAVLYPRSLSADVLSHLKCGEWWRSIFTRDAI